MEHVGENSIKIVEVSAGSWLKEIGRLRAEVWRGDGFEVPDLKSDDPNVWVDAIDRTAFHWIALDGEDLAGAARLSLHKNPEEVIDYSWLKGHETLVPPVASFNRLVVRKEFRGQGVAKQLDDRRFAKALELGAKTVCVVAVGDSRVSALEELGFHVVVRFPEGHGLLIPEQSMTGMIKSIG